MKNTMLKELDELLDGEEYDNMGPIHKATSHTLTVKGLCSNSSVEIAKQIAYIAAQETKDSTTISDLYIIFSMYSVYLKIRPKLHETVYTIIKNSLKEQNSCKKLELAQKLNDEAYKFYKYGHLQSYKRYYPESYRLNEDVIHTCNVDGLLLLNNLMNKFMNTTIPKNSFSILDYSKAVLSGSLTDDFVEFPILKYCQKYLEIIDDFIKNAIDRAESSLDDKTACNISQLLNWRNRFVRLSNEAIFAPNQGKRRQVLREDIVSLLYAHSKWLQKNLIQPLCRLIPQNENMIKGFDAAIKDMVINTDQENTELTKLSKKMRKMYGQPKLFVNQEEYDICNETSQVYSKLTLDMNQPISKQLNRLSVDNYVVTDMQLALDVANKEKIALVQENITKFTEGKKIDKQGSQVKLLPIISYVVQRILTILQRDFLDVMSYLSKSEDKHIVRIELSQVLASLVHLGKVTKGFPPALLNLMEVMHKLQENGQEDLSDR